MKQSIGYRLEQYTLRRPQEVLLVKAIVEGEADEISIFKGFSSSLMRPTAFDPDVPILPETATVESIDRLQAPYQPDCPRYIQQNLSLAAMLALLEEVGV
ncbi:MAG: hypothetical protein MUF72_08820 [Elainella sp. Prado103]|nr:hypothetical protein [Elainella sp. Prado103]